jgi:hypothetical protein
MYPFNFVGAAAPLSSADIEAEAAALACSPALVHAFSDVESAGSGFLSTGAPKILFEAHSFHKETGGQFDDEAPDLSSPTWDRTLYGAGGAHQYARLERAMQMDKSAALRSCSWGRYQLMGSNFKMALFASVEDLVEAFCASEAAHLKGFGNFCVAAGLLSAMRADPPDFPKLARVYNGVGYAEQGYDVKLAGAFRKYATPAAALPAPNSAPRTEPALYHATLQIGSTDTAAVTELQNALNDAQIGFSITADGSFGAATEAAVKAVQTAAGLVADGVVGPRTFAAIAKLVS